MSIFWSIHRGVGASAEARSASRKAASASSKAQEVEDKVDRALLVCEALWTILREKLGMTEEELVQRVNDIDLSDGKLDGKVRKQSAVTCPSCNRTFARRFPRCIYCGQPVVHDPFA